MKELILLIIIFGLTGCLRKFYHFERSGFEHLAELDKNHSPEIECFDQVFVLRLDTVDRFVGGEFIRMRDTASGFSSVQYSYFVFQKNGRVYFNTFVEARDSSLNKDYSEPYQHIDGQIPRRILVNDSTNLYSRQGHYSITSYQEVVNDYTSKEIFQRSPDKSFIEIELERKFNPRLTPKFLNVKHRDHHYFLTAEIKSKGSKIIGDTLTIIRLEMPRKITPLTAESSPGKEGSQVMDANEIFTFPLKFVRTDELPIMECPKCVEHFECAGCLKPRE